jgi:hypothetical protein
MPRLEEPSDITIAVLVIIILTLFTYSTYHAAYMLGYEAGTKHSSKIERR